MTFRILASGAALLIGLASAGAQQGTEPDKSAPAAPAPRGGVQITSRAPEPDKWVAKTDTKTGNRVFVCKPLACPDAARVTILNLRSPTRNPDPQALEKFAKVDFPKSLQKNNPAGEGATPEAQAAARSVETLASGTARLKGFPSVSNESQVTTGDKVVFLSVAIIFAGPAMIQVSSISPDRALAQKSLNQFVDAMEIKDAPASAAPPQPALPRPSTKPQSI